MQGHNFRYEMLSNKQYIFISKKVHEEYTMYQKKKVHRTEQIKQGNKNMYFRYYIRKLQLRSKFKLLAIFSFLLTFEIEN